MAHKEPKKSDPDPSLKSAPSVPIHPQITRNSLRRKEQSVPPSRIPLNFFGIPFGLAGLGDVWLIAARFGLAPVSVGEAILGLAAAIWLILIVGYARYVRVSPDTLKGDLVDATVAPFASLVVITPVLLAAEGLTRINLNAGRIVVDLFIALTVALGGWFTGRWMRGGLDFDRLHPGYFLPTVAGGFVAALGAADVGQRHLAEVLFGLGLICWLILGSMIMARLFFRPPLPDPLAPTMAIEIAPAAVASLAYFAIHGDRLGPVISGIGGYGLLMVLAQIPLLPRYFRLHFMPSFWAFTFAWAAIAEPASAGSKSIGPRVARHLPG
jgi:tellurite resistance protein